MQTNLAIAKIEFIRCPRCERPELTVNDFGICRARPSDRNLYCARCIREKIARQRRDLREYKAARIKAGKPVEPQKGRVALDASAGFSPRRIARMLRKLTPKDRVLEAVRCGAETQTEIARVTRLPKDEVGDCIAQALLYDFTIRTEMIDGVRRYFTNESGQARIQRQPVRPREPQSHGVSTIYFQGDDAVWKFA